MFQFLWRVLAIACVLTLVGSAPARADAITITYPSAPGASQSLDWAVHGELLSSSADPNLQGLVTSFSFWLVDPGAGAGPLSYQMGIAQVTGTGVDQGDILYQSAVMTLNGGIAGESLAVSATIPIPISFDTGASLFFYIVTTGSNASAWQIETMGTGAMGCCGGSAGPGLGLRAPYWFTGLGLRTPYYLGSPSNNYVSLNETAYDQDIAMSLTLQTVPEPGTLSLIALGAGAAYLKRRRARKP